MSRQISDQNTYSSLPNTECCRVKPGSQYDDRLPFRFVSFRFVPHRSVSVVHKLSFASTAHRPSVSCIPPRTKSVSHTFLVIVRYSWKMCSRSRRVLLLLLLLRRRRARRHSSTPKAIGANRGDFAGANLYGQNAGGFDRYEQSGFALFLDDGSSRANSIILFRSFDSQILRITSDTCECPNTHLIICWKK